MPAIIHNYQVCTRTTWSGETKNLIFLEGASPEEILLVDDYEKYVHPGQENQWIKVPNFDYPYSDDDLGLGELLRLLRIKVASWLSSYLTQVFAALARQWVPAHFEITNDTTLPVFYVGSKDRDRFAYCTLAAKHKEQYQNVSFKIRYICYESTFLALQLLQPGESLILAVENKTSEISFIQQMQMLR